MNVIINNYYISNGLDKTPSNFMFSYTHENNPALMFIWNILPYKYFYMLTLVFPLTILLCLIYIKQIIQSFKKH